MATNPYFNLFNHTGEQNLYDDLVVESIRMFAHDLIYLPRTIVNEDKILNEPTISEFNQALDVEMYIKSFDSFEGEGELLSKFGLEIRDQMSLILSHRSFNEFIKPSTGNERPFEGDVIYVPMTGAAYQIKFVNQNPVFFTLGKLNVYEITCELLEFSNEQFNTGRPEIDNLYAPFEDAEDLNYNLDDYDNTAQNSYIETEADSVLDFSEINPFGGEE